MKRKTITVGRTLTINLGNYESDRPHAEITAELEEDDDLADCVGELIDQINVMLMATHESNVPTGK
jgi:hypothetical protein